MGQALPSLLSGGQEVENSVIFPVTSPLELVNEYMYIPMTTDSTLRVLMYFIHFITI